MQITQSAKTPSAQKGRPLTPFFRGPLCSAQMKSPARLIAATLACSCAAGIGAVPASGGHSPASAKKPPIRKWLIPFGPKRKHEMAAYSERHYGEHTWRLRHPRVIVEHVAVAAQRDGGPQHLRPRRSGPRARASCQTSAPTS